MMRTTQNDDGQGQMMMDKGMKKDVRNDMKDGKKMMKHGQMI